MNRGLLLAVAGGIAFQEPAPKRLTPIALPPIDVPFATISGARELRDGRILVSDAKRVTVHVIDPRTGKATLLGSAGGDSLQYAQPGGFYAGRGDTTLLLDRGLRRLLVISPSGAIVGSRSIARKGTSGGSDADVDLQRLDARGLVYFPERTGIRPLRDGRFVDSLPLVRFDAGRQHGDTIALLRQSESIMTRVDEHSTFGQTVVGSPQDEWGVSFDGRVVVVHAVPYRVEWHGPKSEVVLGPTIAVDPIRFTAEERAARKSEGRAGGGVSASMSGGQRVSSSAREIPFAESKAPFDAHAVIVSPDAHVWVERTRPFGALTAVYDVFDAKGDRTDRVELPARARVIGFGRQTIFVKEFDDAGRPVLKRYKLPSSS